MALKRISGVWLRDGKNGKFMASVTETDLRAGSRLMIFKNTRKSKDSDPDYVLNVVVDDEQPRGGQHSPAVGDSTHNKPAASQPPLNATPDELVGSDQIPF